jgi:hypothetical protein
MRARAVGFDLDDYLGELVERLADGERLIVDRMIYTLIELGNPWTLGNGEPVLIVVQHITMAGYELQSKSLREYADGICSVPLRAVTQRMAVALKQFDPSIIAEAVAGRHDCYTVRRS